MSYQLDITDNALCIRGLFGEYKATDDGNGFSVSVSWGKCASEFDEEGEDYFVDAGQEWSVPAKSLSELNAFIASCEGERLWNYIPGPTFWAKADPDAGTLFIKGVEASYIIGSDSKGLYLDRHESLKDHNYVGSLDAAVQEVVAGDKWWSRPAVDTLEMQQSARAVVSVTDGGRLRLQKKGRKYVVWQKPDGGFYVGEAGDVTQVLHKGGWKDVLALIA